MTHDEWFKGAFGPNISENSLTYRDTRLAYNAALHHAVEVLTANENIREAHGSESSVIAALATRLRKKLIP